MDTELLVEERIDDGRKLITELVRSGFDVTVALWIKSSEEGLWFFYIGSADVDAHQLGAAYRRVYACLSRMPQSWIAPSEIKLVNGSNPIAQESISLRDRHAARIATRYHGKRLANIAIDEAYIYPKAGGTMTRAEVLQTIASLLNVPRPSQITLRDGRIMQAMPKRLDRSASGDVQIELEDDSGVSHLVSADDVANIQ